MTKVLLPSQILIRNYLRNLLWTDDIFAHKWLCHPNEECCDGCNSVPIPARLEFYNSDLEI